MNELIKENATDSVIAMARLRTFTFLGLLFVAVLFLSSFQYVIASDSGFILSQDVTRPDIFGWGIEGEPELGNGFDVWANVTDDTIMNDDDPGLRNVTVQVIGPNMSLDGLLTHNGTFYTGSVPAFPNDGEFWVRIRAYDLANNTRTSGFVIIEYLSDPIPTIDPAVTMPIVVGSSLGLMVIVVGLAWVYDKRKSAGE
jgi:hypothetical protein